MKDFNKRVFGNELKYVEEVISYGFRSSKGAVFMRKLEQSFAEKFGSKNAISFINGTATMHALLEAKGIGEGDEVICTPLTMSAPAFAVLQANATPVFADVDPKTFNIDPKSIEERITPKTKAIITVSIYGLSPDMDPIMALAKKHNLFVIEDNAETFLAKYKGRMVGTLGHASSFSFQSSKHMTSGEGGMVLTDDAELATRTRQVGVLGYAGVNAGQAKITKKDIQDPDYSRHVCLGWNYRLPELCAAVALGQLENLEDLVGRRVQVARLFNSIVSDCSWLKPQLVESGYEHSYWTYVVKKENPDVSWHQFRDRFQELGGDGIYACWKLSHLEPMFQNRHFLNRQKYISKDNLDKYSVGNCPVAEAIQPNLLQFKTNYWDYADAEKQAEILKKTIATWS